MNWRLLVQEPIANICILCSSECLMKQSFSQIFYTHFNQTQPRAQWIPIHNAPAVGLGLCPQSSAEPQGTRNLRPHLSPCLIAAPAGPPSKSFDHHTQEAVPAIRGSSSQSGHPARIKGLPGQYQNLSKAPIRSCSTQNTHALPTPQKCHRSFVQKSLEKALQEKFKLR